MSNQELKQLERLVSTPADPPGRVLDAAWELWRAEGLSLSSYPVETGEPRRQ